MSRSNDSGVHTLPRAPRADRQCIMVNRLPQTSRGPVPARPSQPAAERAGTPGPSGRVAIQDAIRAIEAAQAAVVAVGAVYGDALREDVVARCTGVFRGLDQQKRAVQAIRRDESDRDWRGLMDEGAGS